MESIWTQTTAIQTKPSLDQDKEAEVAIIGAGMAGILTAHFLKQKGISAIVLEAKKIGDGQTKNTTAKITSQHGLIYGNLIKTFGKEKARQYAEYNQKAIEAFCEMIQEKRIDCDFRHAPAFLYSRIGETELKQEAQAARELGIDAQFTKETELPYDVAGAVMFEGQGEFHPLKFLQHVSTDLEIFEDTRVEEIKKDVLYTNRGAVKAKKIIFATHYPFVNRPGYYFLRMHQQRSYVLALRNAMELQGIYFCSDRQDAWSYRQAEDLLLLGGGAHRTGIIPCENPYDLLRQEAARCWPECEEVACWSAQDCMTYDGVPYIGQFSKNRPNWYVATGFQKWGMTSSMVAAKLLTGHITEAEPKMDTIFDPSRFHILKSLPSVLREGAGTVKHLTRMIRGKAPACEHLGCGLSWNPYEKSWECPCHGSRFHEDGALLDNPAQEDLRDASFSRFAEKK